GLNELEPADLLAELLAFLHVVQRHLEGALRDAASRECAHAAGIAEIRRLAPAICSLRQQTGPRAARAQQVDSRHLDAVEEQLRQRPGLEPDGLDVAALEGRLVTVDYQLAQSLAAVLLSDAEDHDGHVGNVSVADPAP